MIDYSFIFHVQKTVRVYTLTNVIMSTKIFDLFSTNRAKNLGDGPHGHVARCEHLGFFTEHLGHHV